MNRRAFVSASGAAAAALAGISSGSVSAAAPPRALMKLGCQSAPTSGQHLQYLARYGVEGICGYPEIPEGRLYATVDELRRMRDLAEKYGIDVGCVGYEVMYFLDAEDDKMHGFREVWSGIGDSIVIVGGDGLYNCHIHTDDIGGALEAALDAGRPREIRVTDLSEQVIEERWVREGSAVQFDEAPDAAPATSVVAVVVGDGVGRIFRSLGVRVLVAGGQSMNPSTADLVAAVEATGSDQVVLLPNNKNIRPVAEQVNALVDQTVTVVPTNSIVEGFAALLEYDPDVTAAQNATAMSASACNVVAGEVTQAVRDTTTDVGDVHVGDWIGLSSHGVRSIDHSIAGASKHPLAAQITPP